LDQSLREFRTKFGVSFRRVDGSRRQDIRDRPEKGLPTGCVPKIHLELGWRDSED
jgi:hypothetical protein